MTTERIIDRWIYPMNSSSTPYNETNFSHEVIQLCKEEVDYINSAESVASKPLIAPVKSRLRIAKCNVVGDPSVGKTCLINRFGYDVFDSNSKATIGVDFDVQKFSVLNRPFTLQIWDTAGDERFRSITRTYYRGAHAALIVFDLSLIKSFQNATLWYEEVIEAICTNSTENGSLSLSNQSFRLLQERPFIFLVGTKKDLITEDTVEFYRQEGAKLAEKFSAEFWMVSSTTGENVSELFKRVACLCFDRYILRELRAQQDKIDLEYKKYQMKQNDFKCLENDEKPMDQKDRRRSVRYSAKNGGQVAFYYEDRDRRQGKNKKNSTTIIDYPQTIRPWLAEWWSQWFGKYGKIRRRLRRMANNRNITDTHQQIHSNNDGKSRKKSRNKTFQCFRLTCMVSVD